jgi:redox-sensing transcriptional repressor
MAGDNMAVIPEKTIGRLSLYRRILGRLLTERRSHLHSHDLASLSGSTAAQVRRDLMTIGYSGSPARGYDVQGLIRLIDEMLDGPEVMPIGLVGVGNLGRAVLTYFSGRRPNLKIVAAFDDDPDKVGRLVGGCPVHRVSEVERVVREERIRIGVVAVPAEVAQKVADLLVAGGVRGILNFAPVALRVPRNVHVEDQDLTMSMDKVAYYARTGPVGDQEERRDER